MDTILNLDINFKQDYSNRDVEVSRTILYRLFYSKRYAPKSGGPFNIRSILGPYCSYNIENLDLDDNLGVTFIQARLDERPFMLCLEKTNNTKLYYCLKNRNEHKWEPMDELNKANDETRNKLLLNSIKLIFSLFFVSEIQIDDEAFDYHSIQVNDMCYEIVTDYFSENDYYRILVKPETVHSISKVLIFGDVMEIDGDLRFVKDFYIHYVRSDRTSPLVIETKDYEIGDYQPLYNYYKRVCINDNKWIGIECATRLKKPKCNSDLERILEEIVKEYRNHPVTLISNDFGLYHHDTAVKRFSGIPFIVENRIRQYFGLYSYVPKANKSFFIKKIKFGDVEQKIDLRSRESSRAYSFYIKDKKFQPVLLAFKLQRLPTGSNSNFIWFKLESLNGNEWTRFEFHANPHWDDDMIEQKIRNLYESNISIRTIVPSIWLTMFGIVAIIGTMITINCSTKIVDTAIRIYRHFRP